MILTTFHPHCRRRYHRRHRHRVEQFLLSLSHSLTCSLFPSCVIASMSLLRALYPSEEEILRNPFSLRQWWRYLIARTDAPFQKSFETLNNTFERALVTMHKVHRVWIMYLKTLNRQKLVNRTRTTFDRALPVTQHDRIWEPNLIFNSQKGIPIETSFRVYRRCLRYDTSHMEAKD